MAEYRLNAELSGYPGIADTVMREVWHTLGVLAGHHRLDLDGTLVGLPGGTAKRLLNAERVMEGGEQSAGHEDEVPPLEDLAGLPALRPGADRFIVAIDKVSGGEWGVFLLAVTVDLYSGAPKVYGCTNCACLFWPDPQARYWFVDRYRHTSRDGDDDCGQPCACHSSPRYVNVQGEVCDRDGEAVQHQHCRLCGSLIVPVDEDHDKWLTVPGGDNSRPCDGHEPAGESGDCADFCSLDVSHVGACDD